MSVFCSRHWRLAPSSSGKTVWWGVGPRRTKRWNVFSINLCVAVTPLTCCAYIFMRLLWKRGRVKPDPSWQRWCGSLANTGAPSQTVYYNGKAAEHWQCYITCILTLANAVFCLPVCQSARRSAFIVCTSCVDPNQPNWVLGISLIPVEWLYFLSAPTHRDKYTHTFKRHNIPSTLFFL